MDKQALQQLMRTLAFAARKHRDQRRKDIEASPYINHPITLADILVNEGGVTDRETLIAALLHDTIEDTDTTAEEIASEFGLVIAGLVMEVSDDGSLSKLERKELQIRHAPDLSHKARLVKLADKIANLRDIDQSPPADWSLQRKQAYFDWAKAVIDGLRGTHEGLEAIFDAAYRKRPEG
ncbi:MAG: HD domain-containing protein [Candidatus Thiodiazotropha sp. (ex Dulcina madagascariensis)]|nr:HD domain-containing protein [Candidatus Thiodiazotropha sp. (ex Dulcina madagascariensis)]MCU7928386.1 HD domain-containing protein [Candidatus Thiodiazotropha sp. (ex Dulcina madagascariensis)]